MEGLIKRMKEDGPKLMKAVEDYYKSMLERTDQDTPDPYLLLEIGEEYRYKYEELREQIYNP